MPQLGIPNLKLWALPTESHRGPGFQADGSLPAALSSPPVFVFVDVSLWESTKSSEEKTT